MINILSYVGMSLQSEVCLWTLLGLVRTIFDATLFKVNANLKQVWQMTMPDGISLPVQRVLRTMISGVMLVQCFTVYVYIAAYVVLLYPIFLEERPTLVLPWLLLAAVRRLLCELTCLALGLGICVMLGPTRASCVKFVILKMSLIIPGFYMWLLILRYYNVLKIATTYKTFPIILESSDQNNGLELAIRRRRTKSLFGEDQLRKKLALKFSAERNSIITADGTNLENVTERMFFPETLEPIKEIEFITPLLTLSNRTIFDTPLSEDWLGTGAIIPRDSDRILEQFSLMLLQIHSFCMKEGIDLKILKKIKPKSTEFSSNIYRKKNNTEPTVTLEIDQNSQQQRTSYIREYPKIFKRRTTELSIRHNNMGKNSNENYDTYINIEKENSCEVIKQRKRKVSITPNETLSLEVKRVTRRKVSSVKDTGNKVTEGKDSGTLTIEKKIKNEHISRNLNRRRDSLNNNPDK